ncbi:GntP family permease [Irregularibacter muris]|uniref:GntP family permease n=1 Tax=Irregularibacter muris TaxID=1796619 RepID=A0AAE3HF20_9FIRM|nr:GntP family permease [Irregularibacter muris]MCR1899367.1 GntP family permease [Irregularibacter muris]
MSAVIFFVVLAIAIAALMLLITKVNMHPVITLLIVALFTGVGLGFSGLETMGLISEGFGGTLKGVGLPIMLGAVLAMGIQDTGAAKSIANFFIRLFKGKKLELAPSLTAFIVSIPVFGDITTVLTSNIASILSTRKGISMATMAAFTVLGLNLTHGVVPPTPGILAVTEVMGADLGLVIFYGIIISLVGFMGTWLLLRRWTEKEKILPNPNFVKGIKPAKADDTVEDLLIEGENLPGTFASMLPILIPVVLISLSSFINMYVPEGNAIREIFAFLGDKVVALSLAVAYTMFLGLKYKKSVIESNYNATHNDNGAEGELAVATELENQDMAKNSNIKDILLNSWIARGLEVALAAILITGMGGAFSQVIKSAPAVNEVTSLVDGIPIPGILIPFLLGVLMMTAVGSMTTAGMTAAALVYPMLPVLGLTPLAATLAIGSGTLALNHVNNSGFWVTSQFFNLSTKQTLKYITFPHAVAAVINILVIWVLSSVGII